MKKTLIMKILSGAVFAALSVAGAVNVATTEAHIHVAAENGTYVAEADAERLAVSDGALPVAETKEAAAKDNTDTEETAAEDNVDSKEAVTEDNADIEETAAEGNVDTEEDAAEDHAGIEEAAAFAAVSTTETNDAEEAEAAKAAQSTQSVQQTQKADVVTEDHKEDQVYTAASESVIRIEFPPEEAPADDEENHVYTAASEYTITIEFPPEEAPAVAEEPTPAPEPVFVEVTRYNCNCGYTTYNYDELKQHMFQHALNGDRNSYSAHVEKVQQ